MKTLKTRPPLARMAFIRSLLLAGKPFNAFSLARELEVNNKTISRDIEFMRDRLGYKIEFDNASRSFKGAPPVEPVL